MCLLFTAYGHSVEVGFVTPSVLLANDADTVGSSANLGMYITDGDPDHQFKVVWSRSKSGDNIKAGLEVSARRLEWVSCTRVNNQR